MRHAQRVGTVLFLLVAGLVSTIAIAQEKKPENPAPAPQAQAGSATGLGFDGGTGILMMEQIQKELELNAEQVEKLRTIQREVGDQMRGLYEGLGDLKVEERPARYKAVQEKMREIGKASQAKVAEVLQPAQAERLKQINLQLQMRRGGYLLSADVISKALDMSDAEREQFLERERKVGEELRDKIAQAQSEARGKLLEGLSAEQRAKLEEMLGKPFEFQWGQGAAGGQSAKPEGRAGEEKK